METLKYDISSISAENIECFKEMITYASPYVNKTEGIENGEIILSVTDGKADEVASKLDILKKSMTESAMKCDIEEKVIFSSMDKPVINTESVYEQLLERKDVVKITDGVYAYGGLFLKVFNYFSKRFSDFAYELCGNDIERYTIPVLYPASEYERGKYFENFPHHIMFQTLIKNDIEVLDKFAKNKMNNGELLKEMRVPKNVLRHAACVPIYQWNENTERIYEKPKCYLIDGKCFRNEDKNVFELSRLNEFYMKEVVVIGTQPQVADLIGRSRQLWINLIEEFGLAGEIKSANDSFFASNYLKLKLFQQLGESKYEFRLLIPARGNTIASGSSNLHRTHFTMEYNIRTPESFCHSGCTAIGFDRMAFAFLSQKGLDTDKWDEYSRKEILGEDKK